MSTFHARMQAYKDAAFDRVQRGQGGGKAIVAKLAPVEADTFVYAVAVAVASWNETRSGAQEDFRRAAFPDRYELEW